MYRVKFAHGGPAEVPDLMLESLDGLEHSVAGHIVRRVKKLKMGKWFVQVAHDQRGGYLAFHGSDEQISFQVC